MNTNLFTAAIALFLLSSSCKKKGDDHLQPQPEYGHPHVIGYSVAKDSTNSYNTLWDDNLHNYSTDFIFKNSLNMHVVGVHKLASGTSGYHYHFGMRYFNNKPKFFYWSASGERSFSDELGLNMQEENCSTSTTDPVTGEIYMLMDGKRGSGQRITYYYKIDRLGKLSYEILPNASSYTDGAYTYYGGYNYITLTKTGVAALKRHTFSNYTYIGLGIEGEQYPRDLFITIPGHTSFDVTSMHIDENNVFYVFGNAFNTTTKEQDAYIGRYDPQRDGEKVKVIPVTTPDKTYSFSQGVVESKNMYIPAFVDNVNKPAYFTMALPGENTASVTAQKTDLAIDPMVSRGYTVGLYCFNNNVYVCGQQGNFACIWEKEKLTYLDSAGLKLSYPTAIYKPMTIIPPQ